MTLSRSQFQGSSERPVPKQFQTQPDAPQERKPKKTGEVPTPHGIKKATPVGIDPDILIEYGPKHSGEVTPKKFGEPVPEWAMRNPHVFGLKLSDA